MNNLDRGVVDLRVFVHVIINDKCTGNDFPKGAVDNYKMLKLKMQATITLHQSLFQIG